ncbi:MAG: hypothetical protein Q4G68_09075 [Planctomycetia bacterium]|nr:hypothetical protein [Planctomycetia bacterium]
MRRMATNIATQLVVWLALFCFFAHLAEGCCIHHEHEHDAENVWSSHSFDGTCDFGWSSGETDCHTPTCMIQVIRSEKSQDEYRLAIDVAQLPDATETFLPPESDACRSDDFRQKIPPLTLCLKFCVLLI